MNEETRQAWLSALRNGQHDLSPIPYDLRGACALGVLADIYGETHPVRRTPLRTRLRWNLAQRLSLFRRAFGRNRNLWEDE